MEGFTSDWMAENLDVILFLWKKYSNCRELRLDAIYACMQRSPLHIHARITGKRLYSPVSDWFGTAHGIPFGSKSIGN